MTLLEIENLGIEIRRDGRTTHPVRGISLTVAPGETVGVVGETGCGKTLTGLSVLGLLPPGARATGSIRLERRELLGLPETRLREIRGGLVAMVFQNPGTAFDPVRTIGAQFERIIRRHRRCSAVLARRRAEELLTEVELADTDRVLRSYPHQLSGGMLQRAMIALALSCQPRLIICDEATSALDVTVAQQVRRLLLRLQEQHGFGTLFITHNLAEAYDLCDRVTVLYAGEVAETGPVERVFGSPLHPYTKALLAALPRPENAGEPLTALLGSVPANILDVRGCVFANRCPQVVAVCDDGRPSFVDVGSAHAAACHFAAVTEVTA
jgi:oligopeptide/dipeptide ABC transporter ATP-binding protein